MEAASSSPLVLLVDDDAAVRRALKMLLASIGWQTVEAANAQEALGCLTDRFYDLVIVDINMPGMNGIELCRLIHKNDNIAVPICLVLSGLVDDKVRKEACLAGATSVLTKPLGRQDLIDEFKKHGLPCL